MTLVSDPGLTPEEHRLRDLISEISERCWYAGWETTTEFDVWRLATEGGRWGRSSSTELADELDVIRSFAEEIDRWIVSRTPEIHDSDHEAIVLADWLTRYAAWRASRERSDPA